MKISPIFYGLLRKHELLLFFLFSAQVSPSAPIFFQVIFPKNVDSLLVKMSSPDQYCAILSVQNITCPVYDLDLNIQFEGSYQTADELGTLNSVQFKNKVARSSFLSKLLSFSI